MTSIPMSAEVLKERYELYLAKENRTRAELNALRRSLASAVRDRKAAHRKLQKAIEEEAR